MLPIILAATIIVYPPMTINDPNCAGWTVAGTPPNQTLVCGSTPPPVQVPVCNVTGPATAQVNTPVTLTANCSPAATSYAWTGSTHCVNAATCVDTQTAPGTINYTVAGTNAGGTGAASPPHAVAWASGGGPVPPPSHCDNLAAGATTLVIAVDYSLGSQQFLTRDYGSFDPTTGVVMWFTTPNTLLPNEQMGNGRVSGVEYDGPPTGRDWALSSQPCDFTGAHALPNYGNGTGSSNGFADIAPSAGYNIANSYKKGNAQLQPNTSYYFNLKNTNNGCNGPANCNMILYFQPAASTP